MLQPRTQPQDQASTTATHHRPTYALTMDDLVTWLRAQLDEDERDARHQQAFDAQMERLRGDRVDTVVIPPLTQLGSLGDPDRVLAEVDAKRRILDWLAEVDAYMDRDDMSWHRLGGAVDVDQAVRMLALPYADRHGWREEWRA